MENQDSEIENLKLLISRLVSKRRVKYDSDIDACIYCGCCVYTNQPLVHYKGCPVLLTEVKEFEKID